MHAIQLGPSQPPLEGELPKDFIRWLILEINGRVARVGSKCEADITWPNREAQKKLEERYIAIIVEPSYDRNGYYDPGAGFVWEDEYQEHVQKLTEMIGVVLPQSFFQCPRCSNVHTAPTRHCRECGFSLGEPPSA